MTMSTERNLRRTVLPNGLIVLTERMDHLRSVAMGVWIKSGSRCEPAETNGFRLTTEVTGERGVLNVFYQEYELIDMLRDHLGAEAAQLKILRVDYQNVQNDVIVSNSDVIIWGRLPG